jgi:short-subunit dehydrogenase
VVNKYLKQYEWANIKAMLRNNKASPKECLEDFTDRLVVITGATSGIGYHTAREYASHGANLLLINRNEEKSQKLCEEIQGEFHVKCEYLIADFARLADVVKVGNDLIKINREIDVLIHNAGVYSTKKIFTEDNIELVFQVDYLASFILNYMLKEKLKAQKRARIILVNSEGHRFAILGLHLDDLSWKKHRYSGNASYGVAKLAQILSMYKFEELFKDSGVTINAMHPGNVKSNMGENNGRFYKFFKHNFVDRSSKSPEISATALYYLGVSQELEGVSGKFYNLTTEEEPAPPALDREVSEPLWDISLSLGGLQKL